MEPVDTVVFPGLEARRAAGGDARAGWESLLAEGGPILADGAMGTMLFAAGLQFGDPPEVWNLTHPDVVRRIHRRLPRCRLPDRHDQHVRGNRLRLGLHRLESRVAEINQTAAVLLRGEVDARGGEALVAGDIGPSGAIMAPTGTLEYAKRSMFSPNRPPRSFPAAPTYLGRDDVRPDRDQAAIEACAGSRRNSRW